jgi:hypothetical protein
MPRRSQAQEDAVRKAARISGERRRQAAERRRDADLRDADLRRAERAREIIEPEQTADLLERLDHNLEDFAEEDPDDER